MAAEDAGYTAPEDVYATSVFLASGSGGNEFSQHEIQGLWAKGPRSVGAYQSIAWFYAASTGQISIRDGYKGPSGVIVSEGDRKSTRLNSSHANISYAVFCLKKKKLENN